MHFLLHRMIQFTITTFVFSTVISTLGHAANSPCPNSIYKKSDGLQYIIDRPTNSTNSDIVYYLHGKCSSEQNWNDPYFYTAQIKQYWKDHNLNPPTVVAVSFGQIWLLAQKNSSPYSGLLETFTDEVMPTIEAQLGGIKGRHILLGESMGGFNSLQLSLHSRLFQKTAALCPQVYLDINPFSSREEIENFVKNSAAFKYAQDDTVMEHINMVIELSMAFFPRPDDALNANPFNLLQKLSAQQLPEIYLSAGYYDPYALYEGNVKLAETLVSKGVKVEFHPLWGGHCAVDIPSLAEFLIK